MGTATRTKDDDDDDDDDQGVDDQGDVDQDGAAPRRDARGAGEGDEAGERRVRSAESVRILPVRDRGGEEETRDANWVRQASQDDEGGAKRTFQLAVLEASRAAKVQRRLRVAASGETVDAERHQRKRRAQRWYHFSARE